jgi:hypothetical protein
MDRCVTAMRKRFAPVLAAVAAGFAAPASAQAPGARLFEIVTETGMPHLEWNLRHAVVTELRCVTRSELASTFWMLRDVSLQDCRLEAQRSGDAQADYTLVCTGGHGTSGSARWTFEGERATGQLDVRLGGKNMTFWQRISARAVGVCP